MTALWSTDAECDEVFKIRRGTIVEDIVHDCSYSSYIVFFFLISLSIIQFCVFSVYSCVDILIETETFRILVEISVTVPIRSGHTGNIPTISTKC